MKKIQGDAKPILLMLGVYTPEYQDSSIDSRKQIAGTALLPKKSNGFSLLELMITLSIFLILINFAYPSYLKYLTNARRHDGQLALIDLANRMEQYYAEHHGYQLASLGTGKNTDVKSSIFSAAGWYKLSIHSQTSTSFSLEAKALNTQALHDQSACQSLTLNHLGIKGANTKNGESINDCWQ